MGLSVCSVGVIIAEEQEKEEMACFQKDQHRQISKTSASEPAHSDVIVGRKCELDMATSST